MSLSSASDGVLARSCRNGDPAAWRELLRRFSPKVYRLAVRMLRNTAEAEDACQEVFLRCHKSIATFDATRPLSPWISRITYNVCLRRLDKSGRAPVGSDDLDRFPDGADSPEREATRSEERRLLDQALGELSAQDRALLELHYRDGYSDAELAESTAMAVGTVKTRLHRARAKLREWFPRRGQQMSMRNDPTQTLDLVAAYLDGELSVEEAARFERALVNDDVQLALAAELSLRELLADLPPNGLPPHLLAELERSLGVHERTQSPSLQRLRAAAAGPRRWGEMTLLGPGFVLGSVRQAVASGGEVAAAILPLPNESLREDVAPPPARSKLEELQGWWRVGTRVVGVGRRVVQPSGSAKARPLWRRLLGR